MQYTQLGPTTLNVSRLCLGAMTFGWSADEATSFAIMDTAYDAGLTFIDTADIYSSWVDGNVGGESETMIGKWLRTKDRSSVIIATKVRGRMWSGLDGEGLSRAHITRAVEDSLRRLQTDYIDLYQTHWPDDSTPLEETFTVLDELVKAGKVRYIGCSNHTAAQLKRTLKFCQKHDLVGYASLQPHYNLLHRKEFEHALADLCRAENIGVIPYSPLAAGFLTGKYTRENQSPDSTRRGNVIKKYLSDDRVWDALDVVREIAKAHEVPMVQIALAWQLAQAVITAPIVGVRKLDQLEVALGAVEVQLTADEIARLNQATVMF